jgi:hypothetical protein
LKRQQETTELIKNQIHNLLQNETTKTRSQESGKEVDEESDEESSANMDKVDLTTKLLASSTVSKKFMEWLVSTGNAQEVLDLIR